MSRKPPPITEEQQRALTLATKQGGKLYKNEAAWGPEEFDPRTTKFGDLFSFGTVRALVTRGAMRWSLHDRRNGSLIHIEAEVVEAKP